MRPSLLAFFISLLIPHAAAASDLTQVKTVFVIMEENHEWSLVNSSSMPYLVNTLLPQASYCTNYRGGDNGALHPSEPNYLWFDAGTNFGITNDDPPLDNRINSGAHLETLLSNAGHSWRYYQEDISPGTCPLDSVGNYTPKHDASLFFDDDTGPSAPSASSAYCIANNVPFTQLASDLSHGTVADYNFITPNKQDNMHDGTMAQADAWLQAIVPAILASSAYQNGGCLMITWDEAYDASGATTSNPIGMIVLSPLAKGGGYNNAVAYSHSSALKSIEEAFGLSPLLGDAASPGTADLSDLFIGGVKPSPVPADTSGSGGAILLGPVPVTGKEPLCLHGGDGAHVDVYSLSGAKVASFSAASGQACWDHQGIIAGVYAAHIRTGVTQRVQKIVILR